MVVAMVHSIRNSPTKLKDLVVSKPASIFPRHVRISVEKIILRREKNCGLHCYLLPWLWLAATIVLTILHCDYDLIMQQTVLPNAQQ
jgi:hypothetical protein